MFAQCQVRPLHRQQISYVSGFKSMAMSRCENSNTSYITHKAFAKTVYSVPIPVASEASATATDLYVSGFKSMAMSRCENSNTSYITHKALAKYCILCAYCTVYLLYRTVCLLYRMPIIPYTYCTVYLLYRIPLVPIISYRIPMIA